MSENVINQNEAISTQVEDTTPEAQEKKKQKKKLPTGAKVAIIVVSIVLVLAILGGALLACGVLLVGGVLIGLGLYFGLESQEGDFVYRNGFSGVRITSYTGNSDIIDIPSSLGGKTVTEIDSYAFYGSQARVVYIPDSVLKIGTCAFESCVQLEEVYMGSGVREIDDFAFCDCRALSTISLSVNVEEIGYNAFGYCTSLYEMYIPHNVNTIEEYAFEGCENLCWVIFENPYGWVVENEDETINLSGSVELYEESIAAILLTQHFCGYEWENVD